MVNCLSRRSDSNQSIHERYERRLRIELIINGLFETRQRSAWPGFQYLLTHADFWSVGNTALSQVFEVWLTRWREP